MKWKRRLEIAFRRADTSNKTIFPFMRTKKEISSQIKNTDGLFVNEMTFYLLLLNEVHK